MSDDPTAFYSWWAGGGPSDLAISQQTRVVDPRGKGVAERTVRRVRFGLSSDARAVKLLMTVTGLDFEAFLPSDWLAGVRRLERKG